MMIAGTVSAETSHDAELVAASLAGNRDAFGQIIARYQSLVCSLAYSATGSLSQSEDLAQETFVAAWQQLAGLREPEKLRAWLCGIARNLIGKTLRRRGREPGHAAEPLEAAEASPAATPLPSEHLINREEEAILWRALERIPETYREPLVLFYREHQSVEAVAEKLELSGDAVRQRLSRGRKMLQEQVLAFVEGALEKTAPDRNFTLGVLAALPMGIASAKAATAGAALATGGAAAKGALTAGSLGGLLAMTGGACISFRAQADDSKSPRERQFMLRVFGKRMLLMLLWLAAFLAAGKLDFFHTPIHADYLIAAAAFSLCVYAVAVFDWHSRQRRRIQIEDNTFVEAEWILPRKVTDAAGDPADDRLKNRLKPVRFMAAGIGITLFLITQEAWKQHWGHAILMTAYCALALFWGYLQWQKRPRYQSLRAGWTVAFPVLAGLTTLFAFNWQQYLARSGPRLFHAASPAETITFNLVVVLAYAGFMAILLRIRQRRLES